MKFSFTLTFALFLPVLVNAQPNSSIRPPIGRPSRASSTPSASPSSVVPPSNSTHVNVQVAPGGQFVYKPSSFTARNGTLVTFHFPNSIPHSVTEGYFNKPCEYLVASGGNPAGFDSGLLSGEKYTLKITNSKEPIFFFCKTTFHCGLGMVGAINAPATGNTYAAYLAAAKALGSSEPVITNTGAVTGGVGATPVPIPSSSSANSSTVKTSSSSVSSVSSAPRTSVSGPPTIQGSSSTSKSIACTSKPSSSSSRSKLLPMVYLPFWRRRF